MAPEPLTVDVDDEPTPACLRLTGELDYATAPLLRQELDTLFIAGHGSLVLDLTELGFCDSAGLAAILTGYRGCREAGGRLLLVGVDAQLEKVLRVTGLLSALTEPQPEQSDDADAGVPS
ncbi:STAS domain-containing protein [Allokutzneria oryzae]|uniref:Anti-sigma factor antagonist n=1 Tax=Allokutzneria oryzae TaxID=1378989 RepID=A0ABV5ZRB3_9PSEU